LFGQAQIPWALTKMFLSIGASAGAQTVPRK
jgi:hypothetical protein